jgi:hypothetical protein
MAAAGAAATLPRINLSWTPLDDGFYAYVAHRLLRGDVLHRDFFSQYFGYQHVLHMLLFKAFGEDYLSLRYLLPLLTFLSNAVAAWIFSDRGRSAQVLAIVVTSCFSYLLFNNPSTSWTCVFLALACVALAKAILHHDTAPGRAAFLRFAIGVILGITFGVRHPTAIFIGMGVFSCEVLSRPAFGAASRKDRIASLLVSSAVISALLIYMFSLGSIVDGIYWISAPLAYAILCVRQSLVAPQPGLFRNLAIILSGFVLAIFPIILYTSLTASWQDLVRDLGTFGGDYSARLGMHTWYLPSIIADVLLQRPSIPTILACLVSLGMLTFILLLWSLIIREIGQGNSEETSQWLRSPLTVIAAFHTLVILALLMELYLVYVMPLIALAVLSYFSRKTSRVVRLGGYTVIVMAAITAFSVMSSKLGSSNIFGFLAIDKFEWKDCPLPRCSVKIRAEDAEVHYELDLIISSYITSESTVTILPYTYHFDFSHAEKSMTAVPDTRIPFYQRKSAEVTFSELMAQEDPTLVVLRQYSIEKTVDPKLLELITGNCRKVYEDKYFIILKKQAKSSV